MNPFKARKIPGMLPGIFHIQNTPAYRRGAITRPVLPYLCTSSIKPMMIGMASVWWLAFMASIYLDRFS